ncbi:MAG TPA: DUF2071 domain-containing protein [Pirellulales bacterium]|jgi:hypothetical protein|nr:DUF2071 domain-containing protein [Pirellulales bacterium]
MLYRLKRHPLTIAARFDDCLVLTYAMPARSLKPLLPRGLELDERDGLGFVAVALVQTRGLRPAAWPQWLGQDFFLAGYRVFARYRSASGPRLRGLRILRSDADRRRMVIGGNLLTHYNYRLCQAEILRDETHLHVCVKSCDGLSDLDVTAVLSELPASLPAGSPFASESEARRFAGPLPWTFDYEPSTDSMVLIKGVRQHWRPRVVSVDVREVRFLQHPMFSGATPVLASAFHTGGIEYRWEPGIVERLCATPCDAVRGG